MRRKIVSLAGSAALLGLAVAPWSPPATGAEIRYVSGPGGAFVNYTVPVIVMRVGDNVKYTNADVAPHDVVATTRIGPDTAWCAQAHFPAGQCPLIWSPLVSLGGTADVYGTENLVAGDQVEFKCTLHPNMKGTLVVSPA
jgi:plastocyanin